MTRVLPPAPRLLLAAAAALVALRLAVFAALAWQHGGLVTAMCQFDCFWYARIGTLGYLSDAPWDNFGSGPNWAFFPLYPMLLGSLAAVTGLSGQAAGMALSNLFLVGLLLAGARYLAERGVSASPFLWFGFVLAMPHTLFYSAVYTEALFALLSLGCLLALRLNRPLLAGLCAALASATRPQGILLTPIVAAHGLRTLYVDRAKGDWWNRLGDAALPVALAPLGLCLYVAAQYWVTGDGLMFNHVQILWRREWLGPLEWFRIGLLSWDWHRLPREPTHSYETAWALAGLAVAAWCAWRRRWSEAFFLAASILLPAASGLDSLPRYVATNPVFLLATFTMLARLPARVLGLAVLPALALLHVPLLLAWFRAWGAVF